MNAPTKNLRGCEFNSPQFNPSAQEAGSAVHRGPREMPTRWRVNRLFWIKDARPHSIRPGLDQRGTESGEPECLGFRSWSADVEVDVKSPLTKEAFHAMPFADQIEFLRTWKPVSSYWDGPAREGLAATVQEEVTAQPLPFFENVGQFTGLDPLYLTALMRGFAEGLHGETLPNWEPFWTFASWVLAQPDPETEIRDEFSGKTHRGRRWQSCRLEVARFLDAVLNGQLTPLPLIERASVWPLIDVLLRDPGSTPADEAREDECIMDPFALSLNTVGGVAVHAVFSFIRWIRSHCPEGARGGRHLSDVPEAREALEVCLDPRFGLLLTARSVVGANLTRLAYWAEAWLGDHLEQIFPIRGQDEPQNIGWETFIRFSLADSRTLALLRAQYSVAIVRMSQPGVAGLRPQDIRVSLGQNLVMSYCRGMLDFEQPGDLLGAFFECAPERVQTEVMAFVGRSLAQSDGAISPEMFARLLKLWNWLVHRETPAGGPGLQDRVA